MTWTMTTKSNMSILATANIQIENLWTFLYPLCRVQNCVSVYCVLSCCCRMTPVLCIRKAEEEEGCSKTWNLCLSLFFLYTTHTLCRFFSYVCTTITAITLFALHHFLLLLLLLFSLAMNKIEGKKRRRMILHVINEFSSCERGRLGLTARGERLMNSFSQSRISYLCSERRAHCLLFPWHTCIYSQ